MKSKAFYIIITFIFLITLSSCKPDTGLHSYTYDIDQPIDSITINWGVGDITFIQSDTFKLEEIAKEKDEIITTPLSFEISDDHLTINHESNTFYYDHKNLNVYCDLNIQLNRLCITAEYSIITLNNLNIDSLYVKVNHCQYDIKNCNIKNCLLDTPLTSISFIEKCNFETLNIRTEKIHLYKEYAVLTLKYNTIEKCDIFINDGISNLFYNDCKNMTINHRYGKTIFRLRTVDCDWGYLFKVNIANMEHYHNEINFVEIENDLNYENVYQYKNPNGDGLNTIEIDTEGEIHVWN